MLPSPGVDASADKLEFVTNDGRQGSPPRSRRFSTAAAALASNSMRELQSLRPVETTTCVLYRGIVPSSGVSRSMSRPLGSQAHGAVVGAVSGATVTGFRREVGVAVGVRVAAVGTGMRAASGRTLLVDRLRRKRSGSGSRILVAGLDGAGSRS